MAASANYPAVTLLLALLLILPQGPGAAAAGAGDQDLPGNAVNDFSTRNSPSSGRSRSRETSGGTVNASNSHEFGYQNASRRCRPGVLLLTNGNLLRGTIRRDGDLFHVDVPHGRLTVRASQVERVAANLPQLYQQQRQALDPTNRAAAARLVAWCLKVGLLDQAERELDRIEAGAPQDRQTPLLRRRLALARSVAATAAARPRDRPRRGRSGRPARLVAEPKEMALRQSARGPQHFDGARAGGQRSTVLVAEPPAHHRGADIQAGKPPGDPFAPAVFNRRYWPDRARRGLAP